MKIIIVIPVKGTSNRIVSKNSKNLCGIPLFIHSVLKCQVLLHRKIIDELWIDTECEKIIDILEQYNLKCNVFRRDKSLANNKTDGNQLFLNEIKNIDSDIYIQLLCTSPFLNISTILKAIDIIKKKEYDSVVVGTKNKLYCWENNIPLYDIKDIPNSNTLPDIFIESMSLYCMFKNNALKLERRIGNNPFFLETDGIESIDINYENDFSLANKIQLGLETEKMLELNSMKHLLSSEILIDVMSEMGLRKYSLPSFKINFKNNKIFGRSRLINLRYLKENENPQSIYDALNSYDSCSIGNIIFVNNPCKAAYFGGLNGAISTKLGVNGVVINGYTRDYKEVKDLNLTTLYKDLCPSDIKNVGTVDTMNKKIKLENITIYQNDLIFGDVNGIIIIPKEYEEEILQKALFIVQNEKDIKNKILTGINVKKILDENGFF